MKQQDSDRHGFQVPPKKEKKKQAAEDAATNPDENHPAWPDFIHTHRPATCKADATIFLTTAQLLDQLNTTCDCEWMDEELLFTRMKALGYTQHHVQGTDMHVWLIARAGPL